MNGPVGYYNVNAPANGFYTQVYPKTQDLQFTALTSVNGHDQAGRNNEDLLYSDNVQFIFVSGSGSSLVVNKDSVGIADLLTDYDASMVTISNAWHTYALNTKGSYEVSAVFAMSADVKADRNTTGYIYIDDSWVDGPTEYVKKYENNDHTYTYWEYNCYINGEADTFTILTAGVDNAPQTGWDRGFYKYYVDALGGYHLTKVASGVVVNENVTSVEGTGSLDKVNGYNVTGAKVVDIRANADVVNGVDKIDSINVLTDFYEWSLADDGFVTAPKISMVTVDGIVSVIYVVGGGDLTNYT